VALSATGRSMPVVRTIRVRTDRVRFPAPRHRFAVALAKATLSDHSNKKTSLRFFVFSIKLRLDFALPALMDFLFGTHIFVFRFGRNF
jgi:hypothetical protein